MSTDANATPALPREGGAQRGRRLGKRARNAVLAVHLLSAAAWIGLDAALAVLVFNSLLTEDAQLAAAGYRVLVLLAVWPLLLAGLSCLASGVLLGLGTKYGLLRYWWVAAKLLINVAFSALVPVLLRPTVLDAADGARQLTAFVAPDMLRALVFPVVVSPIGLVLAVLLSVYKPWGRMRTRAASDRAGPRRLSR